MVSCPILSDRDAPRRLLPAEGVDSGAVLVVKAHLNPAKYMPQTTAERIILLVRHPFDAIWSEYNRRIAGGHANAAGERDVTSPRFAMFARCMGCKWMRAFCGVLSSSPLDALTGLTQATR